MYDDAILWKLVDGELPPAEAAAIETAAGQDSALAARIGEMRAVSREILAGAPKPPPDFAARVTAAALRREPAPVIDLEEVRRFLKRALVAASVLAALGLVYLAVEVAPDLLPPVYAVNDLLLGK